MVRKNNFQLAILVFAVLFFIPLVNGFGQLEKPTSVLDLTEWSLNPAISDVNLNGYTLNASGGLILTENVSSISSLVFNLPTPGSAVRFEFANGGLVSFSKNTYGMIAQFKINGVSSALILDNDIRPEFDGQMNLGVNDFGGEGVNRVGNIYLKDMLQISGTGYTSIRGLSDNFRIWLGAGDTDDYEFQFNGTMGLFGVINSKDSRFGNDLLVDRDLIVGRNTNSTGNSTASYFIGDGSLLTNLPSSGGNSSWNQSLADLLYHPLENQRVGTSNSPTFVSGTFTNDLNVADDTVLGDQLTVNGKFVSNGGATFNGVPSNGDHQGQYYVTDAYFPLWSTSSTNNLNLYGYDQDEFWRADVVYGANVTKNTGSGEVAITDGGEKLLGHSPGDWVTSTTATTYNITVDLDNNAPPVRADGLYFAVVLFRATAYAPDTITAYYKDNSGNWNLIDTVSVADASRIDALFAFVPVSPYTVKGLRFEVPDGQGTIYFDEIYLLHRNAPPLQYMNTVGGTFYGNWTQCSDDGLTCLTCSVNTGALVCS